jgi:hypothetical protein
LGDQDQPETATRLQHSAHFVHGLQHMGLAEQLEEITAHEGIKGSIPEWKLTRIGARAMGVCAYVPLPDLRLGLRRHIRGEIDANRLPPGVDPDQAVEHLPGSHGHLEH